VKRCNYSRLIVFVLVGFLFSMVSGCAGKSGAKKWWHWPPWKKASQEKISYPEEELPPPPDAVSKEKTGEISAVSPKQAPTEEQISIPEPPPLRQQARPADASELQMINFEFDSSEITSEARGILDKNAQWLTENPSVLIQVEGHCDERGSTEYNFNLGQRRANSVRDYLIGKGVAPEKIHTISYGEERPLDPGSSEEAWAKNRRAQFLIY